MSILRACAIAYLLFNIAFVSFLLFWPRADVEQVEGEAEQAESVSLRKSYADVNTVNNSESINTGCPTLGNLSPRKQIERVNEILGTPNEPEKRLR